MPMEAAEATPNKACLGPCLLVRGSSPLWHTAERRRRGGARGAHLGCGHLYGLGSVAQTCATGILAAVSPAPPAHYSYCTPTACTPTEHLRHRYTRRGEGQGRATCATGTLAAVSPARQRAKKMPRRPEAEAVSSEASALPARQARSTVRRPTRPESDTSSGQPSI
eukprot:scaffold110043_cov55-Phaeocystis_antarctica.AAC.5